MNKSKKTPLDELKDRVKTIECVDDINHKKAFDLRKALQAAQKLKGSTFYEDDSVRAKPIFRS